MKAIQFSNKEIKVINTPRPRLKSKEALIRIKMIGICDTDIHLLKGYYNFKGIPGHEFLGIVEDVFDEENQGWIGKRVVGEINLACNECENCNKGLNKHCYNRTVLGIMGKQGCFAEYLTLPVENLHKVPPHIPDKRAVFTEPLAAALDAVKRIEVDKDNVLIIGSGKLGLLIAMMSRKKGVDSQVCVRNKRKFDLCQKLGLKPIMQNNLKTNSFNTIIEVSGTQEGLSDALNYIKPTGKIILKSTVSGNYNIDLAPIVVDEIKLIGSRCGDFAEALQVLDSGFKPDLLIESISDFSQAKDILNNAKKGGYLKFLLEMK